MARPVNPHRRDALQERHTFNRDHRQLQKSTRARKTAEALFGAPLGNLDADIKSALPVKVFAKTYLAATHDQIEPPATKVAGVVLATVASAMTAGLPAIAHVPTAGAKVVPGGAPHATAAVTAPPPVPPSVLDASSASGKPASARLGKPGRKLLDLSSDIGALVAVGDSSSQINDYGTVLQTNKQNLVAGVVAAGGSFNVQCLAVAVGMLETNHMSGSERDANKDGNGDGSKNCSPLNINVALWKAMGVTDTDWMNTASVDMVRLGTTFANGMNVVGLNEFVGFTRVGSNYANPTSQEVTWIDQYKHGLGTVLKKLQADPTLLSDSRRVEVSIPYIG